MVPPRIPFRLEGEDNNLVRGSVLVVVIVVVVVGVYDIVLITAFSSIPFFKG